MIIKLSLIIMEHLTCSNSISCHQNSFSIKCIRVYSLYLRRTNKERILTIIYSVYSIFISCLKITQETQAPYIPFFGNLRTPFHTTILHFYVLIEPFSHGILDDNLLTFVQQVYHLLLHGNGFVDFRGGGVEVTYNGILLGSWRYRYFVT